MPAARGGSGNPLRSHTGSSWLHSPLASCCCSSPPCSRIPTSGRGRNLPGNQPVVKFVIHYLVVFLFHLPVFFFRFLVTFCIMFRPIKNTEKSDEEKKRKKEEEKNTTHTTHTLDAKRKKKKWEALYHGCDIWPGSKSSRKSTCEPECKVTTIGGGTREGTSGEKEKTGNDRRRSVDKSSLCVFVFPQKFPIGWGYFLMFRSKTKGNKKKKSYNFRRALHS